MTSPRRVLTVAVLASFALSACGGNKPAPPPPPPGDSGTRDSASDSATDSARPDSALDGGLDSAMGDGGAGEAFPGCTETVFEEIDLGSDVRGFQQTVSVAPAASSWGLAWSDASDAFENIRARVVPTRGSLGSTHDVTTGFASSRGASILSIGTNFLVAYYDNSDFASGFELFVQQLDPTGQPMGMPTRLTTNMARDDNPALLRMGPVNLIMWVEDDLTNRVAKAAIVSDAGSIVGSVETLTTPPESPSAPVLSALSGGGGMAWAESRASGSDVVMLRVDSSAALVTGSKIVLSSEHNASGGVDLATNDVIGGAAVFDVSVAGVRAEVRFREVAADGTLPGPERIVTLAPATGRDASIAALAGGWVVAYRALPDGTLTEPTLRLTLLDLRGEVLNSFDGPTVMAQGGRTTVRVAADGRLLVAWEDQDATDGSRRMRAVRVRCAADGPVADGGMPDAGTDAGVGDAAVDAAIPDGGIDPCMALSVAECAAGDVCPAAEICVDDGCGGRRCVPAGHVCGAVDECPTGSSCMTSPSGGVCVRPGGGCTDSRNCALGFACEGSTCIDRRSPCDASLQCPKGFVCTGPGLGIPFCVPVHLPCTGECSAGACVDVDGDGDTECMLARECRLNADCPSGSVCGASPTGMCGDFGPCSTAADCPATYLCQDLYGDGVPVCVAPGGSCTRTSECPSAQICAVPLTGGSPRCI